jgi:uncharacterized membrane protein YhaH (DUF805 family)
MHFVSSLLAQSQSQYDNSGAAAGVAAFGGAMILFMLIGVAIFAFVLIMWWKIFSKAGYSGAMSLLLLIPIANLIALCILAFGDWPVLREVRALRAQNGGAYLPPQGYPQQAGFAPQFQGPPQA